MKSLDKNLFLSDEIKEVYREIMKTVPTDHLKLDDVSLKKISISLHYCFWSVFQSDLLSVYQNYSLNSNILIARDRGFIFTLWERLMKSLPRIAFRVKGQSVFLLKMV